MDLRNYDVTIVIDSKKLYCERAHLQKVSKYFETLFNNERFVESTSDEIILLGPYGIELKSEALQLVLGLVEDDEENQLNTDDIDQVVNVVDYLQVEHLPVDCVLRLENSISYKTWTRIYNLSKYFSITYLESACMEYFRSVIGKIDYAGFDFLQFKNVVKILTSTMQMVCAFEAVLHWSKFGASDKILEIDELLSMINFEAMSNDYLKESVLTKELILQQEKYFRIIKDLASDPKFLIIAGLDSSKSVEKYSPSSGVVFSCPLPPFPCESSAVTMCRNKVIVAGGTGLSMEKVQIYDHAENTWSVSEVKLQTPRYGAKAVTIDDKVFIVGGHNGESVLSSIEVLTFVNENLKHSIATKVPSLKTARCHHDVIAIKQELYIIGGYSNTSSSRSQTRLSSCEVINVSTNNRYDISPLLEARASHSAVVLQDRILVTGGIGSKSFLNKLSSTESYSLTDKTWSKFAPLTVKRSGHCSFVMDGIVYVLGGTFPNSVERLKSSPKTLWSTFTNLAGYSTDGWELHGDIKIPAYRSSVISL